MRRAGAAMVMGILVALVPGVAGAQTTQDFHQETVTLDTDVGEGVVRTPPLVAPRTIVPPQQGGETRQGGQTRTQGPPVRVGGVTEERVSPAGSGGAAPTQPVPRAVLSDPDPASAPATASRPALRQPLPVTGSGVPMPAILAVIMFLSIGTALTLASGRSRAPALTR